MHTLLMTLEAPDPSLKKDMVLTLNQFDGKTWVASYPEGTEGSSVVQLTMNDGCYHRLGAAVAAYSDFGGEWSEASGFDVRNGYLGPENQIDEKRITVRAAIAECR